MWQKRAQKQDNFHFPPHPCDYWFWLFLILNRKHYLMLTLDVKNVLIIWCCDKELSIEQWFILLAHLTHPLRGGFKSYEKFKNIFLSLKSLKFPCQFQDFILLQSDDTFEHPHGNIIFILRYLVDFNVYWRLNNMSCCIDVKIRLKWVHNKNIIALLVMSFKHCTIRLSSEQ